MHGRLLWRALLVTSGGRLEIAEDATAEAFTRLMVHRASVRDPQAWLLRTGARLVIEELRRERRLTQDMDRPGPERRGSALSSELSSALAMLTPDQRLALYLSYYADLPHRDIARLTGSTVAAVKVRLHRGRKTLRSLLEETHA